MANLDEVVMWPDIPEMGRRLKISQNSAYGWIWAGKIEAVRVCGRWRINPQDIERKRGERAEKAASRAKKEARNDT